MQKNIQKLSSILQEKAPLLIAYSGGVDSALLAALALEYAGPDAIHCILIDGPAFSRRGFHEAVTI
ncbi:MAG: TIGR00268 family protein, partial [Methanomicrobiales archaeon]|nr:TIGR00268 family protein [Methanomicrobiales archaeon]